MFYNVFGNLLTALSIIKGFLIFYAMTTKVGKRHVVLLYYVDCELCTQ